ncbi:MAG: 50S ribosomal protein L30 [Clostridia bacterium]
MASKKQTNKLKVTLINSPIGYDKSQREVCVALGLKKIDSFNILPDNDAVRGAIFKVKHLVKVEEVKGEAK